MSTVVNPGTTPKVYSSDGLTIGAGERLEDVSLDEVGQGLVDRGVLRVIEEKKSRGKAAKTTAKKEPESETTSGESPADADSTVPPARRSQETPS